MSGVERLAAEAATHWPEITSAPVLVMERENVVFRVETRLGPHALRLHRPGYHDDAALRSELEWMGMLARAGMDVPAPLPAQDGGFLVALGAGRRASLLSWLPGIPMGRAQTPLAYEGAARTQLFHSLGRQMARMHRLSDGWTLPPGFRRPAWDTAGLIGETPFWGRFWEIDAPAADLTLFARVREQARAALAAYEAGGADRGLIHADLVRENVLVDGETVRFIDFDDCGFGFRMFDIATTVLKTIDEPDAPALSDAMLEGYVSERPLRDTDLAILPLMLVLRSLTYLGWSQARMDNPGIAARAERFIQLAKRMIAAHMA